MHYMKFSSELKLDTSEQRHFWQQVHQSSFCATDGINIAYAMIQHPNKQRAIVISNGRVESYIKYQELIFDLYQQGFSVYALDHRGQGLSDRLTHNPHQGYVDSFTDYTADLAQFIDQVVQPQQHEELFIIAHSMGCTIASDYLNKYPKTFTAAVFSAPMFGIRLPFAKSLVSWLAQKLNNNRIEAGKVHSTFVLGGTHYKPDSFKRNPLTHSQYRYQHYRNLFEATVKAQLGSPTNHWLLEAMSAAQRSINYAKNSQTPILILQAQKDRIVCNEAQNQALSTQCHKVVIEGAFHEVFIESDNMRNIALSYTVDFMALHSKTTAS
ncbi:alpha/beta fold hydrolase [Shewanella livingstonensis]|uniref:Alpha/beta fold hydrolase n=1 Tax=Shewanella livingstonensis TaxID=150120 RepID=A0A3G8LPT6_9GAMM|nr:alpha/beta fold hydrolase [Shewanella livingstonensis]AZG71529.1 alpha/beta fold hydrolase [Shewanella livingstonensis]